MYIQIRNSVIGRVGITVYEQTERRLTTTCFRGLPTERAGNYFNFWNNSYDVLSDNLIQPQLLISAGESLAEALQTDSVCIDCQKNVGWSGTNDISKYKADDLESFNPNRHSEALRVKINRKDLLAPLTNFVTIVYEVRREKHQIAIIVRSMYPGKDIGELHGNITEREKIVFFDWDHPGASI